MKTVTILGATGSVGQSTADVIAAHQGKFKVLAVTAHKNVQALAEIAKRLNAQQAVIADDNLYADLKNALSGTNIQAAAGTQALRDAAASKADITVAAIVGIAGLPYVMAALGKNKVVAIANKEPLVAAGPLVIAAAAEIGATILPIDSEHNAIFQLFEKNNQDQIKSITLTASGGPFRAWTTEQINKAKIEDALKHPNWVMGKKITIDCATLMNKGLEMIEAKVLFGLRAEQINAVIHPQSIVHGFVEYTDGSILAHMGAPDMRTPIAHVLAYPNRMHTSGRTISVQDLTNLSFEQPDEVKFPCLRLAQQVLGQGLSEAIALNAANEVAVESFLAGQIGFGQIAQIVEAALEKNSKINPLNIDDVFAQDNTVRRLARSYIMNKAA